MENVLLDSSFDFDPNLFGGKIGKVLVDENENYHLPPSATPSPAREKEAPSKRATPKKKKSRPNNEMMRAIEAMRDYGKETYSDSDTSEKEKIIPLSDDTWIGGIPWRELKHKLKNVSYDKKDLLRILSEEEKEIL